MYWLPVSNRIFTFQHATWVDFRQKSAPACWLVTSTTGTRDASLPGERCSMMRAEPWLSIEKFKNGVQVVSSAPPNHFVQGYASSLCGLQGSRTVPDQPIIAWFLCLFWKPSPNGTRQETMILFGGGLHSPSHIVIPASWLFREKACQVTFLACLSSIAYSVSMIPLSSWLTAARRSSSYSQFGGGRTHRMIQLSCSGSRFPSAKDHRGTIYKDVLPITWRESLEGLSCG